MTTITQPARPRTSSAPPPASSPAAARSASSTWTSRPARCRRCTSTTTRTRASTCLGGELTLYLPGESVTLRAGEFFLAPRGVPHTYEVGADGAASLVSSVPSGFERFVSTSARSTRSRPRSSPRVAAEHGIEILGPPGARP